MSLEVPPAPTAPDPSSAEPAGAPRGTRETTTYLRELILSGELAPGSYISQVALARRLGISPTPLREAIRLLEADGLLVSEHNRRARVAPLNVEDLDAVYSARVLTESVAIAMTVQRMTAEEMDALDACLAQLRKQAKSEQLPAWEAAHAEFHRLLWSYASPFQADLIKSLTDRAERYRRLLEPNPRAFASANAEHEAIADRCRARDPAGAARQLARHLARTALTLTTNFAPEDDPAALRTAVQIVTSWQA
jgi:DNA-binding GntR family transcriptional regulator